MPLSERVLLETSAIVGLLNSADPYHQRARVAYEVVLDRGLEIWVTSYTVVEVIGRIEREFGPAILRAFLEKFSKVPRVYWIGAAIHDEASLMLDKVPWTGLAFVNLTTILAAQKLRAPVFTLNPGLFASVGVPAFPVSPIGSPSLLA